MPEASTNNAGTHASKSRVAEKECVVTLRIRYSGELPENIGDKLAERAYDFAHSNGKNVRARVRATVVEEA